MKFALAAVAILATAVSAQSISDLSAQIPACAQTCLGPAITGAGCAIGDNACQCGSANAAITTAATPCVISGCSSEEALMTQSLAAQICALVEAGGAGSQSSTASSVTSMASPVASSASSIVSSASRAASSVASSASSAVAGASASRTSSAPASNTNAAGKKEVGGLMAGAALIAALAL